MIGIHRSPRWYSPHKTENGSLFSEISDLSQQVWILQDQTLVAVPRNDSVVPARVTIFPCKFPESLDQSKGTPIYFGIQNPELCLCCEDVGGQPMLQLKEKKVQDLYNETQPVKAFLFYHFQMGSTSTFESVAFPGWFVACADRGQPVFLTSDQGTKYNTAFNLHVRP